MSPLPPPVAGEPVPLTEGGPRNADEQAAARLLAGVPPPAVGDLAVERVWRRLTQPRPRRASGWTSALAGAVAALALVALAGVVRRGAEPPVELTLSSGGVFYGQPATRWRPAQPGESLRESGRLRTDGEGRALVRIKQVASLLLEADSDVALEGLGKGGVFVRLSRGQVIARVAKRPPGEPFVIQTDRFSVKVVGTLFTVAQPRPSCTEVSVQEGVVEVSDANGLVARVTAGSSWSSERPSSRGADATSAGVRTLLEAGLHDRPVAELTTSFRALPPAVPEVVGVSAPLTIPVSLAPASIPPAAVPAIAALPSSSPSVPSASASVRGERPGSAPPVLAESEVPRGHGAPLAPASAGDRASMPSPSPSPSPSRPAEVDASSPRPVAVSPPPLPPVEPPALLALADPRPAPARPAPPVPLVASSPNEPVAAAPAVRPYEQALALEAKGEFAAAAEALDQAAQSEPERGELALYSLGRIAQRNLADPNRALQAFRRCRQTYPGGALAPEVDLSIVELTATSHAPDALEESRRFLAAHPGSSQGDEVRLIRAGLLRDSGDCARALGDYQAIRAAGQVDDALFSTAYCQQQLGEGVAARKSLAQYLERFPRGRHRSEVAKALAAEPDPAF